MEDSFFGYNTSLPLDDDGGGQIEEPSEEEYDALNDETFGSAINGDWEEAHESLVRLTDPKVGDDLLDSVSGGGGSASDRRSQRIRDGTSLAFGKSGLKRFDSLADADLDLNLSGMKLDDVDMNFDDNDNHANNVKVDSSVWGAANTPLPPQNMTMTTQQSVTGGIFRNSADINPANFLRQNFSHPFQQLEQQQQNGRNSVVFGSPIPTNSNKPAAPKICTLEDIERNMIMQQAMQKQQQQKQVPPQLPAGHESNGANVAKYQQQFEMAQQHQQQQLNQQSKTPTPRQMQKQQLPQPTAAQKGPPGFGGQIQQNRSMNNFASNMAQHPLGNFMQQSNSAAAAAATSGNRLPPGLPLPIPNVLPAHAPMPPHPFLNQHGALPMNFPYPVPQHTLPNPHLPVALNNFAMHPNFSAMRAAAAGIHPALVQTPQGPRIPLNAGNQPPALNNSQQNSMFNMFNMRLVQEIQQNHPMLQNMARQQQNAAAGYQQAQMLHQQQQQQLRNNMSGNNVNKQSALHRTANGNLPNEEVDEYANLMSTRDKHWLISIQLSQLNTDTPYIDDFYYTKYKEKRAALSGTARHSQAHKDNQLNHPLTQPKGHAQLILVQLGNKNGTRNGQHRERRTSEASNSANSCVGGNSSNIIDQKTPYVFTPLRFENSLGKLQYGSVTAPRKIIDAEIMSSEVTDNVEQTANSNPKNLSNQHHTNAAQSSASHRGANSNVAFGANATGNVISDVTMLAQRKSRHILLHIETVYRIVLKLEDLENPTAIATILTKIKKENERLAALEQLENANKTPEERAAEGAAMAAAGQQVRKFAYEIESKEALIEKLIAGLTLDKVIAIMNVRKGKILMRRILPFVKDHNIRWQIWTGVFASLQTVVKKDREDADGILYALYFELKSHMKDANFDMIVKLGKSLPTNDKKSTTSVFCSKFVIASLVCLIIRAEEIYVNASGDPTLNDFNQNEWRQILDDVAASLNKTIQNQTICAAIESDCIQPMMNHFARFKDLKLDPLLALISEAKQQIN